MTIVMDDLAKPMKIIMTGGGTGGHIYPAIAIADKIKRKHPKARILFIGTERGMEKDIVPKHGYEIRLIKSRGIDRKNFFKNIFTAADLIRGSRQAKEIIESFRPDLVIGTGGYVCGPVVRQAYKKGVRAYVHEQNAVPGITNRLLERYAKKVFTAFPSSVTYFRHPDKVIVTGNPIRKEFFVSRLIDYRAKLGIGSKDFMLLCFGGSLGADRLNAAILDIIPSLVGIENTKLVFITGERYHDSIIRGLEASGVSINESGSVSILPYAESIYEYFFAADLIISRAGALTISEITACGKPSILIPSPNVTGNHQHYNAKVAESAGGAIIIKEQELTQEKLLGTILRLMGNRQALNSMAKASQSVGRTDSVDVIYDHLGLQAGTKPTARA